MKKQPEKVEVRNFVAHACQTVKYNSGKHINKKRKSMLSGRFSKHKKDNNSLHDCCPFLLT